MANSRQAGVTSHIWKVFRFLAVLAFIVLGSWLCKSALFSVYYIPSGSMSPTLKPGDYVLVSKFPYNLRSPEFYPVTAIPFPFLSTDGLGKVNRGDIVVFDMPRYPAELHPSQKRNYVKRIAGLPGDTLLMYKNRYFLQRSMSRKKIQKVTAELSRNSSEFVAIIPQKGSRLKFTDHTELFWKSILRRDGNEIKQDSLGRVWVNGKPRKGYTVEQDYYFALGDNTQLSSDSRSWGLVPKRNFIGRVDVKLWPWPLKKF